MQISYNWLKEYVDFEYKPEELAQVLTFLGLEVDTIEEVGKNLETILVGEVLSVKPHPHSEQLVVSEIHLGERTLTIVVGAANMVVGDKVPVATPNSQLPDGTIIKETKIRGVTSQGMLCSADELNLSEEREEILILPKDTPLGVSLEDALKLHDYILYLSLTPNYGHSLSMVGVAREIGAKLREKVKYPDPELTQEDPPVEDLAHVSIEDPTLCPRYSARLIKGVRLGPSPFWLQQRLRAAGVRPINNVVDVTNYVMLELGQPLHAFDYDKIHDHQIIVRRARKGETLVTLDEEERELIEDDLVISDPREAIALAGVMGGFNTEVRESTTNILLESAHFQPTTVRRTARRLGLPSEASHRFERGVDIGGTCKALDRASEMLMELASGTISPGIIDCYPEPRAVKGITLRMDRVKKILGIEISSSMAREILESLGLKVEIEGELERELEGEEIFRVQIPTYRFDLEEEIDLVEEIARHHGYHTIGQVLPQSMGQGRLTHLQRMECKTRSLLEAMGLWEIISYSFVSPKSLSAFPYRRDERGWLYLKNPLNEDLSVMRTSLLPGLLESLSFNQKRHQEKVSIYELGKVFLLGEGEAKESLSLGALMTDAEDPWGLDAGPFYYLKGVVESLFEGLGVDGLIFKEGELPFLHPGRQALLMIHGEEVGFLGELNVEIREDYELRGRSSCFELDLTPLLEKGGGVISYEPIPRFPAISRDLALVVHEEITSSKIHKLMLEVGGDLLKEVEVFDLYRGPQLGEGKKSIAFNLNFFSQERTLKDEEVDAVLKTIMSTLKREVDAQIRE